MVSQFPLDVMHLIDSGVIICAIVDRKTLPKDKKIKDYEELNKLFVSY